MRKLFLSSALFLIIINPISSYAEDEMDPYNMQEQYCREELYRNLVKGNLNMQYEYPLGQQEVAKFFGYYLGTEKLGTETSIISYVASNNMDRVYHIGWYADGYIVTQLRGDKKGFQTLVLKDEIVGVSYPSEQGDHRTINQYSWGYVTTYPNLQSVYRVLHSSE
jgi:hypothetical protein